MAGIRREYFSIARTTVSGCFSKTRRGLSRSISAFRRLAQGEKRLFQALVV